MKGLFWVRAVVVSDGNERSEETLGALGAWILKGGALWRVVGVEIGALGRWCS